MFTGRDALSTVEQAISKARNDERGLDAALRSATEEAAQHPERGGRRLPHARARASRRARAREGDRRSRRRRTPGARHARKSQAPDRGARASGAINARPRSTEPRSESTTAIRSSRMRSKRLDELEDKTAERIKGDARWHDAKEAVDEAQEIAANADEKAKLAETDLGEKGKPYANDPLFIYLWTKKHAQAEDRSGTFVRFFDRKVARLIGYSGARANYAMLQEIPARLREHAKIKQADVEEAKRKLAVDRARRAGRRRHRAARSARRSRARGDEGGRGRGGEDHRGAASASTTSARSSSMPTRTKAARSICSPPALAREDLNELLNEASRTPTKADDKAITSIADARASREKADARGPADPRRHPRDGEAAHRARRGARPRAQHRLRRSARTLRRRAGHHPPGDRRHPDGRAARLCARSRAARHVPSGPAPRRLRYRRPLGRHGSGRLPGPVGRTAADIAGPLGRHTRRLGRWRRQRRRLEDRRRMGGGGGKGAAGRPAGGFSRYTPRVQGRRRAT